MPSDVPGRLTMGRPLKGNCRWCDKPLKPHGPHGFLVCATRCDTAPSPVPA